MMDLLRHQREALCTRYIYIYAYKESNTTFELHQKHEKEVAENLPGISLSTKHATPAIPYRLQPQWCAS